MAITSKLRRTVPRALAALFALAPATLAAQEFEGAETPAQTPAETGADGRTIEADIVAMDQALTNRFGSINPYGMIFALRSDVVEIPSDVQTECIASAETPIGEQPADQQQQRLPAIRSWRVMFACVVTSVQGR